MVRGLVPEQGDILIMNFSPQTGHEQKGRRPAVVVSNRTFNGFTGLAMVCPITNRDRNHPLHIKLDERTQTTGFIFCEQVKALDITARQAVFVEKLPADTRAELADILAGFVEPE